MICALPVLCALGLMVSTSAATPFTTSNKVIRRGTPDSRAGFSGMNATTAPALGISKRGSKWGKYATYAGDQFMDESLWEYWTADDPTHGKVK